MQLNLLSCDAQRPDKRAITKCILEISSNMNPSLAYELTRFPIFSNKKNILYKCGWSPFEGTTFKSRISHTILNGEIVYENEKFTNANAAMRLTFNR